MAWLQTGDYDEFRRAYEMSHRAALLYNLADRTSTTMGSIRPISTAMPIQDLAMTSVDLTGRVRVLPFVVSEGDGGEYRVWSSFIVGCSP